MLSNPPLPLGWMERTIEETQLFRIRTILSAIMTMAYIQGSESENDSILHSRMAAIQANVMEIARVLDEIQSAS